MDCIAAGAVALVAFPGGNIPRILGRHRIDEAGMKDITKTLNKLKERQKAIQDMAPKTPNKEVTLHLQTQHAAIGACAAILKKDLKPQLQPTGSKKPTEKELGELYGIELAPTLVSLIEGAEDLAEGKDHEVLNRHRVASGLRRREVGQPSCFRCGTRTSKTWLKPSAPWPTSASSAHHSRSVSVRPTRLPKCCSGRRMEPSSLWAGGSKRSGSWISSAARPTGPTTSV